MAVKEQSSGVQTGAGSKGGDGIYVPRRKTVRVESFDIDLALSYFISETITPTMFKTIVFSTGSSWGRLYPSSLIFVFF